MILGGGVRRAPEWGGDTMNRLTLERVRFGARVARLTGLPVLVSGGSTYGATPEAALMRDALRDEFGIEVRWVEDASRTTAENAARTASILRANGISRVVLVTHSFDVPRAACGVRSAGYRDGTRGHPRARAPHGQRHRFPAQHVARFRKAITPCTRCWPTR